MGIASYLNGYILLRDVKSKSYGRLVLEHEFAHLFGAIDLKEPGSIMDRQRMGSDYNDFISRVIHLNRDRSFNPHVFPLPADKWDEAISLYVQRKSLKRNEIDLNIMLDPNLPEPYNLLGLIHEKNGKDGEALKEFTQAVKLKPDYFEAHSNLGNVYFKRNLLNEATQHYERAIEIDSQYAPIYNNLAVICFYQEKTDLAWRYIQRAEALGFVIHPDFKKALAKKIR